MMDENLNSLLAEVKSIGSKLPGDILAQLGLGAFPFEERAHSVTLQANKLLINFFSDDVSLAGKTQLEKIIREYFISRYPEVVIYFERKEKKAPPQQEVQQKKLSEPHEHKAPSGKKSIAGVKHIIAVASGKGGVGKSTVSVNLALALHNQGYKTGILDADIYGPSVPTMLNIHQDPLLNENNKIIPPEAYGLKVMSFGFFAPEDTAVIWRGPMIMKALQQFFWDVDWGELDFLVIDLPPGTGDAQLTLVQSIPIAGAVIVTTPQNVALLDAVKGIAMFQKTDVPILGVVENMSTYSCPTCGTESHIFGEGGAKRVAEKFDVPLLGQVPLISEIRAAGDLGEPLTSIPGHGVRVRFAEIAEKVVGNLFSRG
jgi:ATP-binding protein involved in chromosome partitioning